MFYVSEIQALISLSIVTRRPASSFRFARASKPSSVDSASQMFAPFSTGRKLAGNMQLKMTNVTAIGVDLAVKRVSCLQQEDMG